MSEIERRLNAIERKIDRILEELEQDDDDRDEAEDAEETSVYDELTLDEAGFESY